MNKLLKLLLLCVAVYAVLAGISILINGLNRLVGRESDIALQNMRAVKYPLFAAAAYLVFTERI